tara:strand:+ start:895 stop:1179 length:285 start_codon:yes stop_codon:yes gene_type:complete
VYNISLPEKKRNIIIHIYKMIYQYKIQTLTRVELGVVLYICNELFDTKVKVDEHTITAYKEKALIAKLRAAKEKVKPEYFEFYEVICGKLGVDL